MPQKAVDLSNSIVNIDIKLLEDLYSKTDNNKKIEAFLIEEYKKMVSNEVRQRKQEKSFTITYYQEMYLL